MDGYRYSTIVERVGEAGDDTIYAFYTNKSYYDIDLHIIEIVYDGGIYYLFKQYGQY